MTQVTKSSAKQTNKYTEMKQLHKNISLRYSQKCVVMWQHHPIYNKTWMGWQISVKGKPNFMMIQLVIP